MEEPLYRIGEAARLLELETYVLRYWETEFEQLQPLRTPKGQRKYSQHHLEQFRLVKHLLHHQGMTIEGARKILERQSDPFALPKAQGIGPQADMFPPPLPSPRTIQESGENGETRVTLVQGSLVPVAQGQPNQHSEGATQPKRGQSTLLSHQSEELQLLLELRNELQSLRDTLHSLSL